MKILISAIALFLILSEVQAQKINLTGNDLSIADNIINTLNEASGKVYHIISIDSSSTVSYRYKLSQENDTLYFDIQKWQKPELYRFSQIIGKTNDIVKFWVYAFDQKNSVDEVIEKGLGNIMVFPYSPERKGYKQVTSIRKEKKRWWIQNNNQTFYE